MLNKDPTQLTLTIGNSSNDTLNYEDELPLLPTKCDRVFSFSLDVTDENCYVYLLVSLV